MPRMRELSCADFRFTGLLMRSMLRFLLALVPALLVTPAHAQTAGAAASHTATTTTAVNVRSAPNRHFPTVTWLLSGTSVTIVGCVDTWRWCDVIAGRKRGWVYTRYLTVPFEGGAVTIITGGPRLGLPVAEFSFGPYWDEHYREQLWFARKAYWQTRWDRQPAPAPWRPRGGSPS